MSPSLWDKFALTTSLDPSDNLNWIWVDGCAVSRPRLLLALSSLEALSFADAVETTGATAGPEPSLFPSVLYSLKAFLGGTNSSSRWSCMSKWTSPPWACWISSLGNSPRWIEARNSLCFGSSYVRKSPSSMLKPFFQSFKILVFFRYNKKHALYVLKQCL